MSLSLLLAIICSLPQGSPHLVETQISPRSSDREPSKVWSVPDLKSGPVPKTLVGLDKIFKKCITVFGIHVLATEDFDDTKFRHVASILAEYLDNDEDGQPDNPLVVEAMSSRLMAMVLFRTERQMSRLDRSAVEDYGYRYLQGQFEEETDPEDRFDATLEEVLHLVTTGYAEAYPRVFGTLPGTELSDCLDRARGGRYARVPRSYPDEAWFHYDDRSCDYSCMGVEYLYWALTSLLGAQSESNRRREIIHEWKLVTPESVRERDPWITSLLTNEKYRWAIELPDGKYSPGSQKKSGPEKKGSSQESGQEKTRD